MQTTKQLDRLWNAISEIREPEMLHNIGSIEHAHSELKALINDKVTDERIRQLAADWLAILATRESQC